MFVNNSEAGNAQAALKLSVGDVVRVWDDRPGSAKRRASPITSGDLRILYEDEYLIVLDKQPHLQYLDLEAANALCAAGAGVWDAAPIGHMA